MTCVLFQGGNILDCTGAKLRENESLLTKGNKIERIGRHEDVLGYIQSNGLTYKSINAHGHTIMPGLFDIHVHPSYGDILTFEELDIYTGCEYRTLRAATDVQKVLRAGVTSICAPGGNWNINVAIRDAINGGRITGPRIVAGGRYITTENAIAAPFPNHIQHPDSSFGILCNTLDEMVVAARKQIKDGVDVVKVAGDGGTFTSAGLLTSAITPRELEGISEVTHTVGKLCTVHARSGKAAADAARARYDWVIHASFMSEDDLSVLLKHRTPINPTLSLVANSLDWGPELGVPISYLDVLREELDAAGNILGRAYREGLSILAGTDSGQGPVPYGEWHARELELLVHYLGMSNMDAILTGTRNPAIVVGWGDQLGTLEEGKLADILMIAGDPLTDIAVLQDPASRALVMKDGQVVDTTTPLPEPRRYRWESNQVLWSALATQQFVRTTVKNRPKWMI